MASRPISHVPPQIELGSPYCSDPNCESCKQLREAQEELKKANAPSVGKRMTR